MEDLLFANRNGARHQLASECMYSVLEQFSNDFQEKLRDCDCYAQ